MSDIRESCIERSDVNRIISMFRNAPVIYKAAGRHLYLDEQKSRPWIDLTDPVGRYLTLVTEDGEKIVITKNDDVRGIIDRARMVAEELP